MSTALTPAGKLFVRRLTLFGVPADVALAIAAEGRIEHRTGKRKWEVEHVGIRHLGLRGLALAEHVARVVANWARCYTVDTTRLAMRAREAA